MSKTERTFTNGSGPKPEGTLQVALDKGLAGVADAARDLQQFLQGMSVPPKDVMSLRLAFIEAGNNAIQNSPSGSLPPIVTVSIESGQAKIVLTDYSSGFEWRPLPELPPEEAERGRGLFLIHAVMDSVDYERGEHGNRLTMRKRFAT